MKQCGSSAEAVRKRCGSSAEAVQKQCGSSAEAVRKRLRKQCGSVQYVELHQQAPDTVKLDTLELRHCQKREKKGKRGLAIESKAVR